MKLNHTLSPLTGTQLSKIWKPLSLLMLQRLQVLFLFVEGSGKYSFSVLRTDSTDALCSVYPIDDIIHTLEQSGSLSLCPAQPRISITATTLPLYYRAATPFTRWFIWPTCSLKSCLLFGLAWQEMAKKRQYFFSRHIDSGCQSHLPHGPQIVQFDFKWAQPVKPMHNELF